MYGTRYVGIYGDADPLDTTQWLEMDYSQPNPSRTWSETTATCSNMFTSLNFQFLVSFTGERSNPQNQIISALAAVTTSDWVHRYYIYYNIPYYVIPFYFYLF